MEFEASPLLPRVANDIQTSMYDALRYLEGRGYRRVGLVMSDDANRRMLCLYSGASLSYDRFFAKEMRIEELLLPDERFDAIQIHRIRAWIKSHRLQAILSSAQHLYSRLTDEGARIPHDFAYAHLHKGDSNITAMDQMREIIGRKTVDLVSAMIQRNETFPLKHPQTVLMPSVLHEGNTVPDLTRERRK